MMQRILVHLYKGRMQSLFQCLHVWLFRHDHRLEHTSRTLYILLSSIISKPVSSAWESARSGHAFTHFASLQPRHDNAKLRTGAIRTTLILDRIGFQSVFALFYCASVFTDPASNAFARINGNEFSFCSVLADIVTKPSRRLRYLCIICF